MKQIYLNSLALVIAILFSANSSASIINTYMFDNRYDYEPQSKSPYLVYKYLNITEYKYEIESLILFYQRNNLEISDMDLKKSIIEGHDYFVENQDRLLMNLKTNELLQERERIKSANKKYREERAKQRKETWGPLLEGLSNVLAVALVTGVEASQQQQQTDYQNRISNDRKTQAYIAQHSSITPKQYSQDFGNNANEIARTTTPRVTTSNGFEEPVSFRNSNTSNNYSTQQGTETVGIMVKNGYQQNVRIKVSGNTIVGIYVGGSVRSPFGEGWSQTNIQGMPTNLQLDGEWSKMYRNRATSRDIDNAIIYF